MTLPITLDLARSPGNGSELPAAAGASAAPGAAPAGDFASSLDAVTRESAPSETALLREDEASDEPAESDAAAWAALLALQAAPAPAATTSAMTLVAAGPEAAGREAAATSPGDALVADGAPAAPVASTLPQDAPVRGDGSGGEIASAVPASLAPGLPAERAGASAPRLARSDTNQASPQDAALQPADTEWRSDLPDAVEGAARSPEAAVPARASAPAPETAPEAAVRAPAGALRESQELRAPREPVPVSTPPSSTRPDETASRAPIAAEIARVAAPGANAGAARGDAETGSDTGERRALPGARASGIREPANEGSAAPAIFPSPVAAHEAAVAPTTAPASTTLAHLAHSPVVNAPTAQTPAGSSAGAPTPAEAVPIHVEWLAANGGGSARLRLDPPNLGPVDVSVSVRGERVEVVLTAPEPAARELMQGQRESLHAALGQLDLRMDHFEVRAVARAETVSGASVDTRGGQPGSDPGGAPGSDPGTGSFRDPRGPQDDRRGGFSGGFSMREREPVGLTRSAAAARRAVDLRI